MKLISVVLLVAAALGIYTALGLAAGATMGGYALSGADTDIYFQTHSAVLVGKATCVSLDKSPVPPGQFRMDTLTANKITVELANDNKTIKHAVADGNVTIDGRRSDIQKDMPPVLQNVHAVAKMATVDNMDKIVLTGDAVVTITEPGVAEPVYTASGDQMTFLVKDGHIKVGGQPAQFAMPLKEKVKSKTSPK